MRYATFILSAMLLSAIYVISSSFPVSAEDETVAAETTAGEVSAASGNNRFVVWEDKTPGNFDIFFRRSTDNGATWKATVNLSTNGGNSENPQIAVSGSNIYVVWQNLGSFCTNKLCDPARDDVFFRRSTDNGATWKATVNLSTNAGKSLEPQLVASGSKVYVVWTDRTTESDLYFRRSTDNGATWKATVNLSNHQSLVYEQQALVPQIAVSGSNVYVVWADVTSYPPNPDPVPDDTAILVRRSTDDGARWKLVVNLNGNVRGSFSPQVAVSGSKVYVVWHVKSHVTDDIFLHQSTDNGATWKSIVNISNNAGNSYLPQIAASGSNVYLTWQDDTPGNYDILFRRSTDNGATWKSIVNISNNAGSSHDPQIAVSGSNVYVVWSDNTPGNDDIFMRRSVNSGATMQPKVQLSDNAGSSLAAQVAALGSNVYLVWNDITPGNYDIFSRRSTDNASTWNGVKNLSTNSGSSNSPQVAG